MKLQHPLKGIGKTPGIYVTQWFGQKLMDYSQFGLVAHNGVDIAAPKGTPIYAAADGFIIEQVSKDTGYGLRICHRIGNFVCVYGHMDRLENPSDLPWNFFSQTYPVKRGQVIGYVDSTGFSTGHHLHFGLYEYDNKGNKLNSNNGYGGAIDPKPYLVEKIMSNQAKVVKSKQSPTVWVCYPIPNEAYLVDKCALEGIDLPAEPPDTDSLF